MEIDFKIIKWLSGKYSLKVDGKNQLEQIEEGDLRVIINEIEKYCRLRFKGELKHKKKESSNLPITSTKLKEEK